MTIDESDFKKKIDYANAKIGMGEIAKAIGVIGALPFVLLSIHDPSSGNIGSAAVFTAIYALSNIAYNDGKLEYDTLLAQAQVEDMRNPGSNLVGLFSGIEN
jgi:hypothetical protein